MKKIKHDHTISNLLEIHNKSEAFLKSGIITFIPYLKEFNKEGLSMSEYKTILVITKPIKDHELIKKIRLLILDRYESIKKDIEETNKAFRDFTGMDT